MVVVFVIMFIVMVGWVVFRFRLGFMIVLGSCVCVVVVLFGKFVRLDGVFIIVFFVNIN